jgi:hypothetical protein
LVATVIDLEALEIGFGFVELGKETLFGLELARVDAAAAGFDADGVLEVEHLVVEQVLDGAARRIGTVEDAADDDGVVSRVVVAKHATGVVGTPRKSGAAEETVEETGVEGLEDLVEVVVVAEWCEDALAAAGLANVLGLTRDGLGGDVAAIPVGVRGGNGFFVELGEQNVGDGAVDSLGSVFEEVGEADVETAFAETDCGVERGEPMETDVERRNGCAGPEVSVLLFKYWNECRGHYGLRLARWVVGCRGRRCGGLRRKRLPIGSVFRLWVSGSLYQTWYCSSLTFSIQSTVLSFSFS